MRKRALQVLLVEDNAGDARLLRERFNKETAGSFELSHLTAYARGRGSAQSRWSHHCLVEMGLPGGHGLDTLRRAHAAALMW
jgi:CheY-like chemotaxis protein